LHNCFPKQYSSFLFLSLRVDALAVFLAIFVLILFARRAATISFVVFAATIVVASVAKTIARPSRMTACAGARCLLWREVRVCGIQTLALFAVLHLVFILGVPTTVTFIPSATTVVVVVVANTVTSPSS